MAWSIGKGFISAKGNQALSQWPFEAGVPTEITTIVLTNDTDGAAIASCILSNDTFEFWDADVQATDNWVLPIFTSLHNVTVSNNANNVRVTVFLGDKNRKANFPESVQ